MGIQKLLPLLVFFLATGASAGELPNEPSAELFGNITDIDQGLTEDSGNDSRNRLLGIDKNADMGLSESESKRISELISHTGDPKWNSAIMKEAYKVGNKIIKWHNKKQRDEKLKKKKDHPEKFHDNSKEVISRVRNKLKAFGNIKMAKNVDKELTGLSGKWSTLSQDQRNKLQNTLGVISSNVETFAKAKEDPSGAIKGAIDIIASITSNFGPTGQMVGMGFSFISSLMGLFADGPKKASLSSILSREINGLFEKYKDRSIRNEAAGQIIALDLAKKYLDEFAREGKKDNSSIIPTRIPTTQSSVFVGKFRSEIDFLIHENAVKNYRPVTDYLDLYAKISVLRHILLTQMIALSANKQDIAGLIGYRHGVIANAKDLFKKLYVVNYESKIIPNFFPDRCPTADAYAKTILGLGKYDRSLEGTYCLVYSNNKQLVWESDTLKFLLNGEPYTRLKNGNDVNCYWKLVAHGDNAYSVISTYKCLAADKYCGALLSITGHYVGVELDDPSLWQIHGNKWKRIRSKDGCRKEGKNRWSCDMQLKVTSRVYTYVSGREMGHRIEKSVGKLENGNGAYVWRLRKPGKAYQAILSALSKAIGSIERKISR